MTCEVVGARRVDMKTDDGSAVNGWSIFVTHEEDGVEGLMAEKTFVSDTTINGILSGEVPRPGSICQCSFNRRGKLVVDSIVQ